MGVVIPLFHSTIPFHRSIPPNKDSPYIIGMVLAFIDLYKECMKGKRFADFQQEWMVNTNNYRLQVVMSKDPQQQHPHLYVLTGRSNINCGIK